ncbi:MAG: EF-hand domain-containing protein [Rhodopirellula sp. JB044]|uniref:EF-hand domain-containing protein n=1 Tax=Rhodopirellula sp. JB044 TaxID=3342844 RepID=UPI003709E9B6
MSRLDRNGNGQIDPDEQQGPASFLIQRLQSMDSSIKPGQPISIKKVSSAFEKMRGGRDRDDERRGDRDDRRGSSNGSEDPTEVEPLVPGFGQESVYMPLLGFGPAAEIMAVPPSEADLAEAREMLRRYDRDKDGQLSKEELGRGRFWGTPMDFDRNGNGKLSESELATREAVERENKESNRDSGRDDRRRDDEGRDPIVEDFEGRRSYRVYPAGTPEGMPRFYTERDLNGDGQVSMSEYTSEWNDSLVAEYYRWDQNQDGVITASEVQSGVNQGYTASDTRRGIAPQSGTLASTASRSSSGSSSLGASSGSSPANDPPAPKLEMPSEPPSEKVMAYAKRIVSKYDENGDLALSATEWGKMLISPAAADFDGDGRITVLEYAGYMTAKSKRRN